MDKHKYLTILPHIARVDYALRISYRERELRVPNPSESVSQENGKYEYRTELIVGLVA